MVSNQTIGRFQEAVALHHAIHCLKFRTNTTDPTIAMVVQISTALLESQMIDILELGICEYHANKNATVVQETTKNNLSVVSPKHNDSEVGAVPEQDISQDLS